MSSSGNAIGIATINAAILAVFGAAAIAYVVVILEHLHDLETEVITAANEINRITEPVAGPNDEALAYALDYDPFDDRSLFEMGIKMLLSSMCVPPTEWHKAD